MKRRFSLTLLAAILLASAGMTAAQEPVTLRFLCFQDRNECEVYDDLLARFTEENPEIAVAVDVVNETEILERLQWTMYDADLSPTISRVLILQALHGQVSWICAHSLATSWIRTSATIYFGALRTDWHSDARGTARLSRCPGHGRALC